MSFMHRLIPNNLTIESKVLLTAFPTGKAAPIFKFSNLQIV